MKDALLLTEFENQKVALIAKLREAIERIEPIQDPSESYSESITQFKPFTELMEEVKYEFEALDVGYKLDVVTYYVEHSTSANDYVWMPAVNKGLIQAAHDYLIKVLGYPQQAATALIYAYLVTIDKKSKSVYPFRECPKTAPEGYEPVKQPFAPGVEPIAMVIETNAWVTEHRMYHAVVHGGMSYNAVADHFKVTRLGVEATVCCYGIRLTAANEKAGRAYVELVDQEDVSWVENTDARWVLFGLDGSRKIYSELIEAYAAADQINGDL
jgi:hypothetical protein